MVLLIHAIQYFEISRIEPDHPAMEVDLLVGWKSFAEFQLPVIKKMIQKMILVEFMTITINNDNWLILVWEKHIVSRLTC